MALFTYQILADFLNRIEDHNIVSQTFSDVLSEDVVLHFGDSEYIGKNAVIEFLEKTSKAMASEYGFDADNLTTGGSWYAPPFEMDVQLKI